MIVPSAAVLQMCGRSAAELIKGSALQKSGQVLLGVRRGLTRVLRNAALLILLCKSDFYEVPYHTCLGPTQALLSIAACLYA